MRAILICALLIGASCQGPPVIQLPILDRMSLNEATSLEKEQVFTQLKFIIHYAKDLTYKVNLNGVVREDASYVDSYLFGGDAGVKAIDALKETYKKSENPQNVLDFLEICLEFMKKDTIPETSKWSFFHEAVQKMREGKDIGSFKDLLIYGDWIQPVKMLEALEILYKTPSRVIAPFETPKIPGKVVKNQYVAPNKPVVGPIALSSYRALSDYWGAQSFFQNGSLLYSMGEKLKDFMYNYKEFLGYFHMAKTDDDGIGHVYSIMDEIIFYGGRSKNVTQQAKKLLEFRGNGANIEEMLKVASSYYSTDRYEFDALRIAIAGSEFEEFLNFLDFLKKTRFFVYLVECMKEYVKKIVSQSNAFNDTEFKIISHALLTLLTFDRKEYESTFFLLFSKSRSKKECNSIWSLLNSTEQKQFLELVDEIRTQFKVYFCLTDM